MEPWNSILKASLSSSCLCHSACRYRCNLRCSRSLCLCLVSLLFKSVFICAKVPLLCIGEHVRVCTV